MGGGGNKKYKFSSIHHLVLGSIEEVMTYARKKGPKVPDKLGLVSIINDES